LRKQTIESLISRLLSSEEGLSEEAFESLSLYFQDEDIEAVRECLPKRGDARSVHWWVRYLVRIERPSGFRELFTLLENEDALVREEACAGIRDVSPDARADLLTRMLFVAWDDVVAFAAEELGKLRSLRAARPLLEVFEEREDEKVRVAILAALGRIRDPQSFKALERISAGTGGKVQEEALAVLGKFAADLSPRLARRCLASESHHVRGMIYAALLRSTDWRFEKFVAAGLDREEERLKTAILSSLRSIQTRRFFRAVFERALADPSPNVRMMARSALKRVKSRHTYGWLKREEKKASPAERPAVMRLLAEFTNEPEVFTAFRKLYLKSSDPKLRLVALESMGRLRDPRVMPFLRSVLEEQGPFAYAAAVALSYSFDPQNWNIIQELLARWEREQPLVLQLLLKFILRVPERYAVPAEILLAIEALLASPDPRVRYLAARVFAARGKGEKYEKLLAIATQDGDPHVRTAAVAGLARLVRNAPRRFADMVFTCARDRMLFEAMLEVLNELPLSPAELKQMLGGMTAVARTGSAGDERISHFEMGRLVRLLEGQIRKEKARFLDIFRSGEWTDGELRLMMKAVNGTDLDAMPEADFDFMVPLYERASPRTRLEFLRFFRKLARPTRTGLQVQAATRGLTKQARRSRAVEACLFRDLAQRGEDARVGKLCDVIQEWVRRG
jgi:HEAT repeat protein